MFYVDLHAHSIYSDGHFTPMQLSDMAQKNSVGIFAISDHDTINHLIDYKNTLFDNMYGTNATEISSKIMFNGKPLKLHILAYGFDENNKEFLQVLNELKYKRMSAHIMLIETLKEQFANFPLEKVVNLDLERYCWFDRDIISCVRQSITDKDVVQLYIDYFKSHKFKYGKEYPIEAKEVIEAINSSGGISVLAHPFEYGLMPNEIKEVIKELVGYGLQGIEVYNSDCSKENSKLLMNEVNKYNLLYSAGTDYHRAINSNGKEIGIGLNHNLCIEETSVSNKLLTMRKLYTGSRSRKGEM